ncbi:complement inhibitor CirpT4-like [Rhipicephalus microplus]|uniref:complement inhibitor CirpT4-like n=1 Tax=Rhipicephalus microplus TaxID=6941 RepID=UPI003F6C4C1E
MWLLSRLLFTATVVLTEWHAVNGYVSIAEVSLQNGECDFNGTKVAPGHPLSLEEPCEMWTCSTHDGQTGHLSIEGCGTVGAGAGCQKVKGTGVYPGCCENLICD